MGKASRRLGRRVVVPGGVVLVLAVVLGAVGSGLFAHPQACQREFGHGPGQVAHWAEFCR